jgi:hypothetical protein
MPDSDIGILIEFEPGFKTCLLKMAHMENELSNMLERKVGLRIPGYLSRYFRQEVHESAAAGEAISFVRNRIRKDLDNDRMLTLPIV